jgi:striatin 1/3/4
MNPLPNRPLVQNSTLPLSLPNLPSFEQMPYNGRPRKVMPEVSGKDFAGLGGLMSGPPSAPASTGGQGGPLLERSNQSNTMAMALGQTQSSNTSSSVGPAQGQNTIPTISTEQTGQASDNDGIPPTAIFRPDDAGEWRERLRLANEASEKARLGAQGPAGGAAWSREDEEGKFDIDDEEDEVSEGGTEQKMWKTRRTLRKSVYPCPRMARMLTQLTVIWTQSVRWPSTPVRCALLLVGMTIQLRSGEWMLLVLLPREPWFARPNVTR